MRMWVFIIGDNARHANVWVSRYINSPGCSAKVPFHACQLSIPIVREA